MVFAEYKVGNDYFNRSFITRFHCLARVQTLFEIRLKLEQIMA